jgi:hypothetical protein
MIRKILSFTLAAMLCLALAAPVSAGRGHGGGFHGGRGGFHHGGGFHRGCCWGGAFAGGLFLGSALAYPYYAYPYYPYSGYSYPDYQEPEYVTAPAYQPQTQMYLAPSVQQEVCYVGGCYRLQGDGVTVAYQWVWVPAALSPPPGPPSR